MVTFKQLWENHPAIAGQGKPCRSGLTDQCAIILGTAFHRSGVTIIPGVEQCWFAEHSGTGHYLRAEELADGLKRVSIPGIQPAIELPSEGFHANILGKTGIIFFKDYWRREYKGIKEALRNRSGDHIDLWNGSRLTNWTSWIRIHLGLSYEGFWTDYTDAKEIWFWRVA